MLFILLGVLGFSSAMAEGTRPSISGTTLVAPITVDGTHYSSAWIFPAANHATFFVEAEPLLETLQNFLPASMLASLRQEINAKHVLAIASLDRRGITTSFDEKNLDLIVNIPAAIRERTGVTVNSSLKPQYRNVAESAFYSGYLNARVTQAYVYPHLEAAQSRQPLQSNLALVNNIGGVVVESGETYTEHSTIPWRRDDSRVVVDSEKNMLRLTAGDLQFPFTGYQSSIPMGGISVTRQFSIQPYTVTRPLNATELNLKRPSTVEVFVNGIFVTKMHLQAGPVDIKDFPLASGLNNVEVRITDDFGQTETVQLAMLFDAQLLREGLHQYSYNVGAPSQSTLRDRIYDSHNITSSFYHRYGVTNKLTLGINFQANEGQRLAGLEKTWMNGLGLVQSDFAGEWDKGARPEWAAHLRYRSLEYRRGQLQLMRYSLESEFKDNHFGGLNVIAPINPYAWSFDAYAVRALPWQLSAGIGYKYQISRTEDPDRREIRADLSKNWSSSWRTGINYSFSRGPITEHRAFVSVTWMEQSGRYYANATYDYPSKQARVDVTRNPLAPYNDVRFTAGAQKSPELKQADLQAELIGSRVTARLDQQSLDPKDSAKYNQSSLSLGSALVWTDSAIGISRPVTESFVILPKKKQLSGFSIPINNNGEYPEAEANAWGPAVLPSLLSYSIVPVSIDGSSLPLGYSVGREFWAAKPSYKSGVTILIGGDAKLIAMGSLTSKNGKALALVSGEVYDGSGRATGSTFFTNRKGQFMIENLKPGRYTLHFFDTSLKPVTINVAGEVGIVKLQTLQVEHLQE